MSRTYSEEEDFQSVHDIGQRPESKWYHTFGDFFNTLKAFIGTNYQALPYAFMKSGLLFGVIGVFCIASLTDYCCQLLVKCKHIVIEQSCDEAVELNEVQLHEVPALRRRLHKSIGYGDVGRKTFGPWCYQLIQILVWYTQFATCIAYFIFLGNTIYALWPMEVQSVEIRNATHVHYIDPPKFYLETLKTQGIPMLNIDNINHKFSPGFSQETCVKLSEDPHACGLVPHQTKMDHQADHELWPSPPISSSAVLLDSKSDLVWNNLSSTVTPVTLSASSENYSDFTTATPIQTTAASNGTNTTSADVIVPSSLFNYISTAPDLRLVILFPLAFFIITSLIRKLRYIAPFSVVATLFLAIGASLVLVKLSMGFSVLTGPNQFLWIKFLTFPAFLGQLISAYEGIGCILPIESSMEDNYKKMPLLLHVSVYIVFLVLCSFGVLGYLRFGETTQQIIVLNFKGGWLIRVVDVVLILSVLFTYPLQCFPVIEIAESYIFAKGNCCGPPKPRLEYDEIGGGTDINTDEEERGLLTHSVEATASHVAVIVPQSVQAWKRNLVRICVTLLIAGIAIALKEHYADFAAITGAIGCAPLAYMIPCAMYLKLRVNELSLIKIMWHWLIIVLAVIASLSALIVIIVKLVHDMESH